MLNFSEFKKTPDRLSDLLPWGFLVAPGVILNKDGSFLSTLRYRGPDLDSSTEAELRSRALQLNNVLKRFGSGWAIYAEARKVPAKRYPNSEFPEPISFLIEEERRAIFEEGEQHDSAYYLTLIYLPPSDAVNKVSSFFIEKEKSGVNYGDILETYQVEVSRVLELLRSLFTEVGQLDEDELLTYLHSTVSPKLHPVRAPEMFAYLDGLLVDSPLITGLRPRLGDHYLRTISVMGFPPFSEPGFLDALNQLNFPYRWVTRYVALEKDEAEKELRKYRKQWFAKRKGIVTLMKEAFTHSESSMIDSDALRKSEDADEALTELGCDAVSYGFFSTSIVLWEEDQKLLTERVRQVERVLNSLGFTTKDESINAVDAWLGSIPGNVRNNIRRPLLSSLNLSHLFPFSATWNGPEKDSHFKQEPLLYGRTHTGSAFRYSLHVGDVGHTMIVGPTGAGKSVLLNFMAAQFLRYQNAQVYIFDKGGSAHTLTTGVGGQFFELGAESSQMAFQPLARCDNPQERVWMQEWVLDILAQENVPINPRVKEEVWKKLESLGTGPIQQRTLFGLSLLLQDDVLRGALQPYTQEGPYGFLLDAEKDGLTYHNWQVFEMEELMGSKRAIAPVLSYIFRRLEKNFDGRPTLLILDEAWVFLDNERFSERIREWLKVLRKQNVSVVFATQSLADVEGSKIAATIRESCPTKIYLPNPVAFDEGPRAFYERFGLNARQIEIISQAVPKREYYYTSQLGNRLFDLALGPIAISYLSGAGRERSAEVRALRERTHSTEEFNFEWTLMKHLDDAHEALLEMQNLRRVA